MRTVIKSRLSMDYKRFIVETEKYHFPTPFMEEMLEMLVGHRMYCTLDGYRGTSRFRWHWWIKIKKIHLFLWDIYILKISLFGCAMRRQLSNVV